jgi:hypothetical protein
VKPNAANSEFIAQKDASCSTSFHQASAYNPKTYTRRLRALGHALEKFNFFAFDLEIRGGTFLVIANTNPPERTNDSIMHFVSESFRQPSFRSGTMNSGRQVALRFSAAEIDQFDRYGKNRRRDSRNTPDPCSISELLRGAGCYLDDRNEINHVKISLVGRWVIARYQTLQGQANHVKHDLDCYYDYWIKMYLRRSSRVELVVPTEPTVLVTGQDIPNASVAQVAKD